jgi:hypothetical protein
VRLPNQVVEPVGLQSIFLGYTYNLFAIYIFSIISEKCIHCSGINYSCNLFEGPILFSIDNIIVVSADLAGMHEINQSQSELQMELWMI